MNSDTDNPPHKKRLSGGCSCIAVFLIAFAAVVITGIIFLTRWDRTEKAWDRLPGGAAWAVQAHDLRALLQNVNRDPGAPYLLSCIKRHLGLNFEENGDETVDFLRTYRRFGFLHTILAPNSLVAGGMSRKKDDTFIILRAPTWLQWLSFIPGFDLESIREETDDDSGQTVVMTLRDGWLVVALRPDILRKVLADWTKNSSPLGSGFASDDAHIAFALPIKQEAAKPPPAHFTLADPFAPAPEPTTTAADEGMRLNRTLILPVADGWIVEGLIATTVDAGFTLPSLPEGSDAAIAIPGDFDAICSVRLSPILRLGMLRTLRESNLIPLAFRRSWLDHAGNDWTLLARPPALSRQDVPFPPLPAIALGWTIEPGDLPQAAPAFRDMVNNWSAFSKTLPAHPLVQNVREAITVTVSPDGMGGGIALPPPLLNGARPAWLFLPAEPTATGWFATDPSGIPPAATPMAATPEDNTLTLAAAWDFGGDFLDSAVAVARDRLAIIADAPGDASREAVLDTIQETLRAYPRGTLHGVSNAGFSSLTLKFHIPFGKDAVDGQ